MIMVFICSSVLICSALDCELNVIGTITVDKLGTGNFTTIQGAIVSVLFNNNRWIRISIKPGIYIEGVRIDQHKPCILLEGKYYEHVNDGTLIILDNHQVDPSVYHQIVGDKASFRSCGFFSLQDTLWDQNGRHYFNQCYIQGAVDFIFGRGQSIYEGCIVNVTAQGLKPSNDLAMVVFKNANVVGNGLAYLGRAYGPYSRVIFVRSFLSQVVVPQGWDAWNYTGHEIKLHWTRSDTSKCVTWEKKISDSQLMDLTQISFID
ncbi:hypothetical protein NE237_001554 [Protea cynaroides]|uniref:Pectinesterase n=1 Tax=Protea cynaroides TaxID=273540 RepID=A0A9Q0KTC0_9MAGN|nr:hypothetical protein NE237_001554 [Protea cynaroides]